MASNAAKDYIDYECAALDYFILMNLLLLVLTNTSAFEPTVQHAVVL